MPAKARLIALVLLSVGVAACGQKFTAGVSDVRETYATTWDGRMAGYQRALADAGHPVKITIAPPAETLAAPENRDLAGVTPEQAQWLGRFDTLVAFKTFRQSEPVMSVAEKWLRAHWSDQLDSLREAGMPDGDIAALLRQSISAPPDAAPPPDPATAYRIGAMTEVRALVRELVEFDVAYHSALDTDLANLPPQQPPLTGSQLDAIINGAAAGARIGSGLKP
jgi:hypothetical protein